MKNVMNKMVAGTSVKAMEAAARVGRLLRCRKGEGFVDTAVKILMSVVIGALVLGGLYALFKDTVLPTLVQRITEMFNFKG